MNNVLNDTPNVNKKPSARLLALVNEWADSYIKSTELPVKIMEQARIEGIDNHIIREIIVTALTDKGLSERRIRQVMPEELKDSYKTTDKALKNKDAAISAAYDSKNVLSPPVDNGADKEKDWEEEYKREPGNELASLDVGTPQKEAALTDDIVFSYLRDRAKETGKIVCIDRVGSNALVQALGPYKSAFGVAEVFLRVIT